MDTSTEKVKLSQVHVSYPATWRDWAESKSRLDHDEIGEESSPSHPESHCGQAAGMISSYLKSH